MPDLCASIGYNLPRKPNLQMEFLRFIRREVLGVARKGPISSRFKDQSLKNTHTRQHP